ncbi:MAG: nucleotidyl transferase AbiEii/AbiGii toxin family protein [Kiritimatiellia bacterium]
MGHRLSVDLDFFTTLEFDPLALQQDLAPYNPRVLNRSTGSLNLEIADIKVDFLRHAYPLLAPPETVDGVRLHSLDDVTAMKLNAIVNRGAKKDFYDIHALLLQRPLPDLVSCFARKYTDSEPFMLVRSLTYFDDAELDPDPVSLRGHDWPAVKRGILASVRSLPA